MMASVPRVTVRIKRASGVRGAAPGAWKSSLTLAPGGSSVLRRQGWGRGGPGLTGCRREVGIGREPIAALPTATRLTCQTAPVWTCACSEPAGGIPWLWQAPCGLRRWEAGSYLEPLSESWWRLSPSQVWTPPCASHCSGGGDWYGQKPSPRPAEVISTQGRANSWLYTTLLPLGAPRAGAGGTGHLQH